MAKPKINIRDEVTNTIIESLKAGVAPWVCGWDRTAGGFPFNGNTGKAYRGVNIMLLIASQMQNGFGSNEWMTYKQAAAKGGQVMKGSKSTMVVFWKMLRVEDTDELTGDTIKKTIPMLRMYNVFNRDQIEGLAEVEVEEVPVKERHARAEALVASTGAAIRYGSNRAAYSPMLDAIQMPAIEAFDHESEFYSASFHELAHWTGHSTRLDRTGIAEFDGKGSPRYAAEELIAELSAAFTCAEIGIEGKLQHAEYLAHWIKHLEGDNNAIFSAASKAKKATDFLLATEGQADVEAVAA